IRLGGADRARRETLAAPRRSSTRRACEPGLEPTADARRGRRSGPTHRRQLDCRGARGEPPRRALHRRPPKVVGAVLPEAALAPVSARLVAALQQTLEKICETG